MNHFFLEIVRSAIWGTALPAVPADTDWKQFWRQAQRQSCLQMLTIDAMNRGWTKVPDALKVQAFVNLQRQIRQDRFGEELMQLLRDNHSEATLLKGSSVAVLYPKREMRTYSDIDLYVGEENYYKAVACVKEKYHDAFWMSEEDGGIHFILVLDENEDRIAEIHRITMYFPSRKDRETYRRFEMAEMGTRLFSLLHIFMHAIHHFESSGVGMRQLADWALVIHDWYQNTDALQRNEDALRIERLLRDLRMYEMWQTFGWVIVHYLGLPKEEFTWYKDMPKRGERLLAQLLRDGHCGRPVATSQKCRFVNRFPWERPQKNRIKQKLYTAVRIVFDTYELAKLFPRYALHHGVAKFIPHS